MLGVMWSIVDGLLAARMVLSLVIRRVEQG
jgi:hypothetical protein